MAKEASTARSPRADRILDRSFLEGLEALPLDELRHRRDEALAEREFQSYLRRLVQVRQDILEAERARRRSGQEPRPMVDRLTAVLSEGPQGEHPRGEAIRLQIAASDVEEASRRADSILGQPGLFSYESLSDQELDIALGRLEAEERAISSVRGAVIRAHDRLQEELKRRYREDPSQALRGEHSPPG